jgi:hypothetical protein
MRPVPQEIHRVTPATHRAVDRVVHITIIV